MLSWVHSCSIDWDLRERDGEQLLQMEERRWGHNHFLQKSKFVLEKKNGVHWREDRRGQQSHWWRNALSTKVRPISLKWFVGFALCCSTKGEDTGASVTSIYLFVSPSLPSLQSPFSPAYNPQFSLTAEGGSNLCAPVISNNEVGGSINITQNITQNVIQNNGKNITLSLHNCEEKVSTCTLNSYCIQSSHLQNCRRISYIFLFCSNSRWLLPGCTMQWHTKKVRCQTFYFRECVCV